MRPSLRLLFFSPDFGLELQLSGSKPTAPSIYLLVKRRLELSNEFGQQLPQSTTQSTTVESCLPVGGVGTRLVDTDRHLLRLHNTRGSTQCRSPVLPSACLQRWARIDCCAWRFHFHIPRSRSLPLASSLAPCRCCSLVRPLKLGKHKHAHTHTQTQISILLRLSATSFFFALPFIRLPFDQRPELLPPKNNKKTRDQRCNGQQRSNDPAKHHRPPSIIRRSNLH